jgi:hypothetical protein
MAGAGLDKFDLPGIGRFSWRKGRESVDTSKYDSLPDDEKAKVQAEFPLLFRTKVTVAPSKPDIAVSPVIPPVFTMVNPGDKFVFTEK